MTLWRVGCSKEVPRQCVPITVGGERDQVRSFSGRAATTGRRRRCRSVRRGAPSAADAAAHVAVDATVDDAAGPSAQRQLAAPAAGQQQPPPRRPHARHPAADVARDGARRRMSGAVRNPHTAAGIDPVRRVVSV